jgi:sugar lactone lactonase YvrE
MNESDYKSELGEGIYFSNSHNKIYWVDINKKKIFESNFTDIKVHATDNIVSAIISDKDDYLTVVSSEGVCDFNLLSNKFKVVSKIPEQYRSDNYRTNDAVKIEEDIFFYGIMDKRARIPGAIIASINNNIIILDDSIFIPNTFIRLPDRKKNELLISDSYYKKIFKYKFNNDWSAIDDKAIWHDFSDKNYTPDGGCISTSGRIFIAIWDGFKVLELDIDGNIIDHIELSIPRPTSCVLNPNQDTLFITSAQEGLSYEDLLKYPLSGTMIEEHI